MKVTDVSDYENQKPLLGIDQLEIKVGKNTFTLSETGSRLEIMETSSMSKQLAVYPRCSNIVHVGTVRL